MIHSIRVAQRERALSEDGTPLSLSDKFQTTIALLKSSERLYFFFKSLSEREEIRKPSPKKKRYLHSLLDYLLEILPATPTGKLDVVLFQALVRYNFNHERVCFFYLSEVNRLILERQEPGAEVLDRVLTYCKVLRRKDMAYNKHAHPLGKEISYFVKQKIKQSKILEPFRLMVKGNVFFPLMKLLLETNILQESSASGTRKSLSYIFRNSSGKRFSTTTIKNRMKFDDGTNYMKLKNLISKLSDTLDYKMKIQSRANK